MKAQSDAPMDVQRNSLLAAKYQKWGEETLTVIERDYYIKKKKLYATASADDPKERRNDDRTVAMMWACGVQLSALTEAAILDPGKYTRTMISYVEAMDIYIQKDELGGYDVWPCPKPKDRYYDDNVWVVIALIKGYEATNRRPLLTRAEAAMKFVLSGEDDKVGGGIYWKEDGRKEGKIGKHACSTGPTIVAALELHRINKKFIDSKKDYLQTALRLHKWMRETLQDKDGLYWDNIGLNGNIGKAKYSYNSALMIRAECLLYKETGDKAYLEEAQRVAKASLKKWVRDDGSADDGGRFAHLLMGAFLELYKVDKNPLWLRTCDNMCEFVYKNLKDKNGLYPGSWKNPIKKDDVFTKVDLLDQASVAHAFLETARAHKENKGR